MSVYKRKDSPFYSFDFQLDGRRFHGSTKAKGRRAAEDFERAERERARVALTAEAAAGAAGPLSLDIATARYWTEVGQHHAGAATTWTNLGRLVDYFGATKKLMDLTDDDVAKLVVWRRSQTVKARTTIRNPHAPKLVLPAPVIRPATVNRSVIEPLQKLFNRARLVWKIMLPNEPDWRKHMLREPKERVREVRRSEESLLNEAIRPDYLPLVKFARASGLRLSECLLRKDQVDLIAGRVETIGKGGKLIRQPITSEMRAILMVEMANSTDMVFTYAAKRQRNGEGAHARGDRLRITTSGLKTLWRRSRYRPEGMVLPADLRFHDLRHDFATKLLRDSGNLRVVQKALHHSKVETTTKYAHVMDEEVADAMEAAALSRRQADKKSHEKSHGFRLKSKKRA